MPRAQRVKVQPVDISSVTTTLIAAAVATRVSGAGQGSLLLVQWSLSLHMVGYGAVAGKPYIVMGQLAQAQEPAWCVALTAYSPLSVQHRACDWRSL